MTKSRGRLPEDELEHYESDIAAGVGIMQSMIRLWHIVTGFVSDDDMREQGEREVKDSFRRGRSITRRNLRELENRRKAARDKD